MQTASGSRVHAPAEETAAPARPAGRAVAMVVALGLAVYLALFLDTALRGFVRLPFGDSFDLLKVEFDAQDRGDPGLYLWHPHNGHHIVWLRLLTHLDVRAFHGDAVVFLVAALVALTAAAAWLARAIWRAAPDRTLAPLLAALAPLAYLTTLNAFDVAVPMSTPYVLATAFATAAFIVVETGGAGLAALVALVALIAAAAMSNSLGLATAPVLMLAVWRRPDRGRLRWLWLAAPLLVALFALTAGHMAVEASAPAETPLARGLRMLRYVLTFCALPWSASSDKMALPGHLQMLAAVAGPLLGALLIGAGLWLAARPSREDSPAGRLDRLCCDLILFSLAVAAMAALGRVNASPGLQIPLRYAIVMAPLQVGVAVLLAIRRKPRRAPRPRAVAFAAGAVMLAAVVHQYAGRRVILAYTGQLNRVLEAFMAGERTPQMRLYVHPNLAHAEAMTAEARRRGLYR